MIDYLLQARNISIGYKIGKQRKIVLSNINLLSNQKQTIAMIGENGVGKSTLLRTIAGLQSIINGDLLINNKNIANYKQHEIAKLISYVSTSNNNLPNLTVSELISLGRFPHTNWIGKLEHEDKKIINNSLELTEINHLLNKKITEISDGEKQRVMIARAFTQNTDIIILDEPTAFLDLANKHHLSFIINKLSKEENKLVIFSTHDLNIAIKYADIIWLMLEDKIIVGAPEDLILNNHFSNIFKNKKVKFDNFNADFCFDKKIINSINIVNNTDSEVHLHWTKKAVERIGYQVDQNANAQIIITKETDFFWKLNYNNKTEICTTIQELIYLMKDKN